MSKTFSVKSAPLFVALVLLFVCQLAVFADGGTDTNQVTSDDSDPGTAWTIRQNYFKRFPWAKAFGPQGSDQVQNGESQGPGSVTPNSGPVFQWPATVSSGSASSVPTKRDEAITKYSVKTFGYPVSDTQFQVIQRLDDNMMLEEAFDPERWMWLENAVGAIKATSAANSMANLERNQAVGAIGFVQTFLENFTADSGNVWNKIRDQLFVPMAVLLLLPGAVLTQVRAIVAQGSPVFGEVNPFEGIFRAIVAIFLIPATYLVVNYGIDVANTISYEINEGYTRVTGGNMYKDAASAQTRAFPIRKSNTNLNQIPPSSSTPSNTATATASDPWSQLESISFDVGATNGNQADADEVAPVLKSTQRAVVNGMNGGLAATWNVLCAFQMAYLYYLFCIGPVVAALWVWPTQQLRNAFPSWVEGVITVCFWSLFWNTTVLLMACFKDVGDTGTIIMSALNFLAISCVKNAFDFAGLVKSAGDQIGQQMQKAGQSAGGHGMASHGRGAAGHHGATGAHPNMAALGAGHGDTHNMQSAMHSPAALHAASAALSHGLMGNSESAFSTANNRTGLFDSSTHPGNSALPPPLTNGATAQHPADDKASLPPIDRSHNLSSQAGDGRGLAAAPPTDSHTSADPGVPSSLNQGHDAAATASGAAQSVTPTHNDATMDHTAVGRAANGMEVAPPPLSGNYSSAANASTASSVSHGADLSTAHGATATDANRSTADSAIAPHTASLNGAPTNATVPPNHDAHTVGAAATAGSTASTADAHTAGLTGTSTAPAASTDAHTAGLTGTSTAPASTDAHTAGLTGTSPASSYDAHTAPMSGTTVAPHGEAPLSGHNAQPAGATHAPLTTANNPAHNALHADAAHPGATTAPAGHAVDQSSMHGLGTLASQSHAGDFHVVDAQTGQSIASNNAHALSQVPGDHNLQAVGADGHVLANYDASHQQWTAAGTHGNVTMGADGNWSAGNHVPVSMDQSGHWTASGTSNAYDAHSNSFDVNGHSMPANAVSGDLLTANANHVPAAEATVHALSQPGVAENLSNALHGDQAAQHAFVDAAHAQGLSPETLYHASQGDPMAAASVMGSHAAADPAYAHQVASSLGVSDSTIAGAAHNPIAQAQVVGAEAQHSAQFAHDAAASIGAHPETLLASAHNPVAAAQVVGAEAMSNSSFAHAVANELHIPAEMVAQAAHNPIMAAQLVGAEAQANPQFAHALSESMGVSPDMIAQAAHNPVLAAQMVGAQAHADASYAQVAAHEMGISPEVLSHAASSPVLAAQVVGMEAQADASFAHFVAEQMHAAPEHIEAMATNPIIAAQAVAYEAQLNHDYGSYVAQALHVEPETLASALSSTRAASHLVDADVHSVPSLVAYAEPVVAQSANEQHVASYVPSSESVMYDNYSASTSYAPSSSDAISYQQDAYSVSAPQSYGDAPTYASVQHDAPSFDAVQHHAEVPAYVAHADAPMYSPVESVPQSYAQQYDNAASVPVAASGSAPSVEWSYDPQAQTLWSSDPGYAAPSDSYASMSDATPPQSAAQPAAQHVAPATNAADPYVAAAYVANASMNYHAQQQQNAQPAMSSSAVSEPSVELCTEAQILSSSPEMAPVAAPHAEIGAPVDMHSEGSSYYVGGSANSAAPRREDRESSSRLMNALGRAAAPKAAAGQPPVSPTSAEVARHTGESLLNQLAAVSRAQAKDKGRDKQLEEQLVELRQVAQQNNWA
ncbi:MAG TPA: hypothetical protein V6C81_04350 [Planktothrix sp.]|jgi:hypothetical protein